jgi:putative inorganic carbon (hco3(-)) transporter
VIALRLNRTALLNTSGAPAARVARVWPFLYREDIEAGDDIRRAGFVLFLLATSTLLLRPADLFPGLQQIPIYEVIMVVALALSAPRLVRQLSTQSLARPITLLIVGMCGAIVISHLARGSLYYAQVGGIEFCKNVLYYLLLLSCIDSPRRLRLFLLWLCISCLSLTIIALLHYHGWIELQSLKTIRQFDAGTEVVRLCSSGIFADPNDLSLIMVVAILICLYFAESSSSGIMRSGWFIPTGLFSYALLLTYSRGGFIALVCGVGVALLARYRLRRAMKLAAFGMPVLLMIFAGRQTSVDLSNPEDTFQTRLQRWSDALVLFKQSPLFGCGQGLQSDITGQVAHNSFVQSYAELGLIGGACFMGAFLLSIGAVYRTENDDAQTELSRMRPYVLGAVAGYAAGLLSLSRAYTVPTYLVLGIAAAYINLTYRSVPLVFDTRLLLRLGGLSIVFILITHVFVRLMIQ